MARAFFILVPALLCGLLGACLAPAIGGVLFVFLVCLGLSCTAPRPERGEIATGLLRGRQ